MFLNILEVPYCWLTPESENIPLSSRKRILQNTTLHMLISHVLRSLSLVTIKLPTPSLLFFAHTCLYLIVSQYIVSFYSAFLQYQSYTSFHFPYAKQMCRNWNAQMHISICSLFLPISTHNQTSTISNSSACFSQSTVFFDFQ